MLTRRGWSFVGAASGLYVGGRVLGLVELCILSAACALLLAGSALWVRFHPLTLRAERTLHERLQVGVDGRVDLTVCGTGGRATPTLTVTDSFDRGRRSARFLLAPLAPGASARAAYRVPTQRRGRFEIGPLRAAIGDPFGIARAARRLLATDEVIVYPRVHDLSPLPHAGGDEMDEEQSTALARVDASGEFHTLREYEAGDDLRRVHWRSTARTDRLMVRQHEARRLAPVRCLLDVRPGAHDRASFERAVEAMASIATMLDRAGRPFEVATTNGEPLGSPGRRQLISVMDELAIVEPHGGNHIAHAALGRRSGALIAVMGELRTDELATLAMLVRAGGLLTVVGTRTHVPPVTPAAAGRRLHPIGVPAAGDFRQSWNEAILFWYQRGHIRAPRSPSPV